MAGHLIPRSLGFDDDTELGRVARKTGSYVEQVEDTWAALRRAKTWYDNKTRWSVSITSSDRLYDVVLKWLLSEESDNKPPRAVKAAMNASLSSRRARYVDDELDALLGGGKPPSVSILYDEGKTRRVAVAGHKILVHMFKQDRSMRSESTNTYTPTVPDQLHFYASSQEGQQAVIDLLNRLAQDTDKRKPALHLMSQWGDWMRRDDLPERELSSVVLKKGQMERLRDDIQQFVDDESEYVRRGMPYHRGYMLHGPPGTGKTSIVRALAATLGLDLWYAPLGDLQKDTSLMSLINQVRPGSILLLEDVDVFHAMKERDSETVGLSMAGLLNALDGVATPHGLITFMTTNDLSVIDPAIIRPGRVDLVEEIGMPDRDQIVRLFNSWYDTTLDTVNARRVRFSGSPAEVTEIFKQNLNDPDGALKVLQAKPAVDDRSVTVTPIEEKRHERAGRQEQD